MRRIAWVAGVMLVMLLSAGTGEAQQAPCRASYRLGDPVPFYCRDAQKTGLPSYRRWGEGHGAARAGPSAAPLPGREWRYFGGYNSAYGFGR
jgi:hypothetical protein